MTSLFKGLASSKAVAEDAATDAKRTLVYRIRKKAANLNVKLKAFVRLPETEQQQIINDMNDYKSDVAMKLQGSKEKASMGSKRINELQRKIDHLCKEMNENEALVVDAKKTTRELEQTVEFIDNKLAAFEDIANTQNKMNVLTFPRMSFPKIQAFMHLRNNDDINAIENSGVSHKILQALATQGLDLHAQHTGERIDLTKDLSFEDEKLLIARLMRIPMDEDGQKQKAKGYLEDETELEVLEGDMGTDDDSSSPKKKKAKIDHFSE